MIAKGFIMFKNDKKLPLLLRLMTVNDNGD